MMVEIIFEACKNRPSCPHGPCLLFERHSCGRRFFACSACRNRLGCTFFQWEDEDLSEMSKKAWKSIMVEKEIPFTRSEYMNRLEIFKSMPVEQKKYCKDCSMLLILGELDHHSNHSIMENLVLKDLIQPSLLFAQRDNKKVEAQFFFKKSTTEFMVSLLKKLGFSKLILIGVPKMHEYLAFNEINGVSSFLMDIDYRYMQFFGTGEFSYYNVFNNHFFDGEEGKEIFKNYLAEDDDNKVVVVLDPPFGGFIDAISHTLGRINKWWQRENDKPKENMPVVWFFPYFFERKIIKKMPHLKMMDYKVKYDHRQTFKSGSSRNTPVRIFTNINASDFALPVEEGYRFCDVCQRFIAQENQHCLKCNSCTTKHGQTYRHCDECQRCVKPSYIHCQICNRCGPSSSIASVCKDCKFSKESESNLEKCFACNSIGHKKRDCPEGHISQRKRKSSKKRK